MFEQLTQPGSYEVPRNAARAWVNDERILPLLDGLDEVEIKHRAACVEAINAFQVRRRKDRPALVVTSRTGEHQALYPTQLRLRCIVRLLPLDEQQVESYLASSSESVAGVREALQADAGLRAMAQQPLLLSIMLRAYRDLPAATLPKGDTAEEQSWHLFATYVERMFEHHREDRRYPRQKVLHWLGWLANVLTEQAQSEFYLERLQPEWLASWRLRALYTCVDRLGSALAFGLVFGLVFGLDIGLNVGLISALFGGMGNALSGRRHRIRPMIRNAVFGWLIVMMFNWLLGNPITGLIFGLLGGLAGALAGRPASGPRRIIVVETIGLSGSKALSSAISGLVLFLVPGMLGGLVFVVLDVVSGGFAVHLAEVALRGLTVGDVNDAFFALVSEFMRGIDELRSKPGLPYLDGDGILRDLVFVPAFGLGGAVLGGLVFALFGGLTGREVEARVTPNQGIRRSARAAMLVGAVSVVVFGLGLGWLG
jgi:hypothetical protein